MSFWAEAGKVFLRQRSNASQNLDTQQRLSLHAQNQGQQMWLAHVAQGYGLQPESYLQPYGVPAPNVNINAPQPSERGGGIWPLVAGTLLGVTGLGAAGGALYAVASKTGAAPTAPLNFKVKVGFDEEKGFQFGQPEQIK